MKKTYNELNMEIIRFAAEDIITTSGDTETPDVPLGGEFGEEEEY